MPADRGDDHDTYRRLVRGTRDHAGDRPPQDRQRLRTGSWALVSSSAPTPGSTTAAGFYSAPTRAATSTRASSPSPLLRLWRRLRSSV